MQMEAEKVIRQSAKAEHFSTGELSTCPNEIHLPIAHRKGEIYSLWLYTRGIPTM